MDRSQQTKLKHLVDNALNELVDAVQVLPVDQIQQLMKKAGKNKLVYETEKQQLYKNFCWCLAKRDVEVGENWPTKINSKLEELYCSISALHNVVSHVIQRDTAYTILRKFEKLSKETREDIIHDVYEKLIFGLAEGKINIESSWSGYIREMLNNTAKRSLKKKGSNLRREEPFSDCISREPMSFILRRPDSIISALETSEEVKTALSKLSLRDAIIAWLICVANMPPREIALVVTSATPKQISNINYETKKKLTKILRSSSSPSKQ